MMEQGCCPCHESKKRTEEEVHALLNRLSRIEGQVRGLRGMVERSAYCPDILNQVAATRAALDAFSRELLSAHIRTCVAEDVRAGREDTVEELVALLQRMMK
ncbi:MAG: metal-sensing transcriptional repressor [Clostridia bacterium]|nr:metal-sensing transcriptional repressor [Clostridia bacterium]